MTDTRPCLCMNTKTARRHDGHCCLTYDHHRPPGAHPACGHTDANTIWTWRRLARALCDRHHGDVHHDSTLGLLIKQNGTLQWRLYCGRCDHKTDLTHARKHHIDTIAELPVRHVDNNLDQAKPCTVRDCTQTGTEMHHFAPRNTFGDDADLWPVLPLCRHHHRHWHTRMDGYRWRAAQ